MAVQDVDPEHRQMARAIAAHSSRVDIDTQWRITVPSACREWAGLGTESPVMVVGVLDRIELWKVELWRERMAPSMESLANGTSQLFSPAGTAPAP
jgi:division/cell wall cluster transcriptional repressor MraZ